MSSVLPSKRHCAYCLVQLTEASKICSKCHRRAYCSKDCQSLDWTVGKKDNQGKGGVGQGHKSWCGITYGEEDLDWAVVPIEGKGLGIRALRDIPPLYRILVEGWLTLGDADENPKILELAPEGGSRFEKFVLNSGIGDSGGPILGVRMSRTNHACDGNASCIVDDDAKVLILLSHREIKAGEEICFSYYHFNDITQQLFSGIRCSPHEHRAKLKRRWSFDCPETCICFDPKIQTLIDKCFDIYGKQSSEDGVIVATLSSLLEIEELMIEAKCTPIMMCRVWRWIMDAAEQDANTMSIAAKYGALEIDFYQKVFHPSSLNPKGGQENTLEMLQRLAIDSERTDMGQNQAFVVSSSSSSSNNKGTPAAVKRHCAYCLTEVAKVKTCAKCHRRAYCSKECQTLDWTVGKKDSQGKGGVGQGHKKWCGVPYGEEDLDWAIVPIEGKGLGMKALRDLRPLYRILVESWLTLEDADEGNPRIAELVPEGGSHFDKFSLNASAEDRGEAVVGLRLSRINHSCDANATCILDGDFKVLILHSNREIKAGEEICFSYYRFNDIHEQLTTQQRCDPKIHRSKLKAKYNFDCPEDSCICFDLDIQASSDKCFLIYGRLPSLEHSAQIEAWEEIAELALAIKCSPPAIASIWDWIMASAYENPSTGEVAHKYAVKLMDFYKKVYHPSATNPKNLRIDQRKDQLLD